MKMNVIQLFSLFVMLLIIPGSVCFDLYPVENDESNPESKVMVVPSADASTIAAMTANSSESVTAEVIDKLPSTVAIEQVKNMFDTITSGSGYKDPMDMMLDMVMNGVGGGQPDDIICSRGDRLIFYKEEKCKGPKIGSTGNGFVSANSPDTESSEMEGCNVVDFGQDCVQADAIKSMLVLPGIMKVEDSIILCAAGAECLATNDTFAVKMKQEVVTPMAYCIDDFERIYEDEYVVTMRGADGVAQDKLTDLMSTTFTMAVCK